MDRTVYCVHHTDNAGRKRRLEKRFRELGMQPEWIESYHPRDRGSWDHDGLSANSVGETSCALKHRDALRRQVADRVAMAVILEDDVELPDGFATKLDKWLAEFEELGGDILMIGTCYDLHVEAEELVEGR